MITEQLCAELLQRASDEEIGICVECSNPELLRNRIYDVRKRLGQYDELMLFVLNKTELWLVKKATELPD